MTRDERYSWIPWTIGAASFAAFAGVLRNGFVNWDDGVFLYNNPQLRGFAWSDLRWMFTTVLNGPYQPLAWLSYALDLRLWGMSAQGFHLTSLLWHGANAGLLFLICRRLLGGPTWASVFAALLFALHPLRVEPAAWASARRDLMSGFFFLLAILLHLRGSRRGTLASYCASLLCKPMAIGLPVVLYSIDAQILGKRTRWRDYAYFAAPAVAAAVAAYIGQAANRAVQPLAVFDWSRRLMQACWVQWFCLAKTVWPSGLAPMYPDAADLDLLAAPYLAGAAAAIVLGALAFRQRRRFPAVWAAWLCFAVLLAPVMGFVKFGFQLVADRYTYLPAMPVSVLAAAGALALHRRRPGNGRLIVMSGAAVLAVFWGLSARQIGFWRDSATLCERILELDPKQTRAMNNLGLHLRDEGRYGEALAQFRAALELKPCFSAAHNNLGTVFAAQGRSSEAKSEFEKSLQCDPRNTEAASNLGKLRASRR